MSKFFSHGNRRIKKTEHGQAVVLLVLLITALIGMGALAVDGGRAYADRRGTQNAADNAALAGAWAICADHFTPVGIALNAAANDGYDNNGTTNSVNVYIPPITGQNAGEDGFVEVVIWSKIEAGFSQTVFSGDLEDTARSVAFCQEGTLVLPVIFADSQTCQNTIQWSGANAVVTGNVHSNNDVLVSGQNNLINGDLSYVTTIDGQSDKITYNPPPPDNPIQTYPLSLPVVFDVEDYAPGGEKANQADAFGQYYNCDCEMNSTWLSNQGLLTSSPPNNILQDGLYYTTGNININTSNLIGNNITLVAEGTITITGASNDLLPFMDDLLLFTPLEYSTSSNVCNTAVITIAGSSASWGGIIYAPNGLVEMSGSQSENAEYWGSILANTIRLSGAQMNINADPEIEANAPPYVSLVD